MGILRKDWRQILDDNERERRFFTLWMVSLMAASFALGYFIGVQDGKPNRPRPEARNTEDSGGVYSR